MELTTYAYILYFGIPIVIFITVASVALWNNVRALEHRLMAACFLCYAFIFIFEWYRHYVPLNHSPFITFWLIGTLFILGLTLTVHICVLLFQKHTKKEIPFHVSFLYIGVLVHMLLGFTSVLPITADFYYDGIWIRRNTPLYGSWVTCIVIITSLLNMILNYFGYRFTKSQIGKTLFMYLMLLIPINFIFVLAIIVLLPNSFVPSIPTLYIMVTLCIFLLVGIIKYNLFPQYEKRYYTMFYKSPICNFVLNEHFVVTEANKQAIDYFQRPLVHENFIDLMKETDNYDFVRPLLKTLQLKREIESYNLTMKHFHTKNNVHFVINAIAIEDNGETFYYIMFRDRTIEVMQQQEIQHLAYYDPLTQLPNRPSFLNFVHTQFSATTEAYLLLIDLNHFKYVNDTYGHAAGDAVLKQVGALLQQLTTSNIFAARLGGDEFIIYYKLEQATSIEPFLSTIENALNTSTAFYNDVALPVSATVGYAKQNDFQTIDEWIHAADQSMYKKKKASRS